MSSYNPFPPDPLVDTEPPNPGPGWVPEGPPVDGPQIGPPPIGIPTPEGGELPDIDEGGEPDTWPTVPDPVPDVEIDEQEQPADTSIASAGDNEGGDQGDADSAGDGGEPGSE